MRALRVWLRVALDPIISAVRGLGSSLLLFVRAPSWARTVASGVTIGLATVFPVALVPAAMISLSYQHGHPLLRVFWDIGILLFLIQVLRLSVFILIPLAMYSLTGLVVDTATRAEYYSQQDAALKA